MTKKIFVEYTGVITSLSGKKQEWVNIEEHTTVEELLTLLGYRHDHHKFIVVTVNGKKASLETILENDVAVTLFLPAGGG